jgi:MinD-like ATPase involved in chromosome partitioning or flagellar assembly
MPPVERPRAGGERTNPHVRPDPPGPREIEPHEPAPGGGTGPSSTASVVQTHARVAGSMASPPPSRALPLRPLGTGSILRLPARPTGGPTAPRPVPRRLMSANAPRAARVDEPPPTPLSILAQGLPRGPVETAAAGVPGQAPAAARKGTMARRRMGRVPLHLPGRLWGAVRGGSRARTAQVELGALGQRALASHSTTVLVTGGAKGGVGKTYTAIALAEMAARAVEPLGGSVVLCDGNLTNPDLRIVLRLPSGCTTVRHVVDALDSGAMPPAGVVGKGSVLRVYAENRETSPYRRSQIDRLARYLREQHVVVVIDVANCLPARWGSRAEQSLAHWMPHADVVVMPVDASGASFQAVAELKDALEEMHEAGDLRRAPDLVMPLLLYRGRRALREPAVREILDHHRDHDVQVVEIPRVEEISLAHWRQQSLLDVSPREVRPAYTRLLSAVLSAGERSRGAGLHPGTSQPPRILDNEGSGA